MIQAYGTNIIVKAVKEEKKNKILLLEDDKPNCFEVISMVEDVKGVYLGDYIYSFFRFEKIPSEEELYVIDQERIYAKKSK
jgi:hypothetical protein